MDFKYTDSQNWNYVFTLNEDNLLFIEVSTETPDRGLIHTEDIAFCEDYFGWQSYHTRNQTPLVSKEARDFCERSVKSFMKMKAFW